VSDTVWCLQEVFRQRVAEGPEASSRGFLIPLLPEHMNLGDCKYNSGDYFSYYKNMMLLRESLGDRAIVMTYEALQEDFEAEVQRLAQFLGIELSEAKLGSVAQFASMGASSKRGSITVHKGGVGNHKGIVPAEVCTGIDQLFDEHLSRFAELAHLRGP